LTYFVEFFEQGILDGVSVGSCGQTWVEAGVVLSFVTTTSEDGCEGSCYFGKEPDKVWLYPGRLNLDLSGLTNTVTSVEVDITDYCGTNCTKAFLYESTTTVDNKSNIQPGQETLTLSSNGASVDRVAVSSCEGYVSEIRLTVVTITATVDPTDVSPGGTSPGAENVPFLRLGVATDSGTATITSVGATLTGTVSDGDATLEVRQDDGDGTFISVDDTQLGSDASFSSGDATVSGLSFEVTDSTKYLFLVLNINGATSSSDSIGLQVDQADITVSGGTVNTFSVDTGGDTSLPVELSSFSATSADDNVILKWRTETELGNIGFSIYRSEEKDGNYTKIGFVRGGGNSVMPIDYQFVDEKAKADKTYFYYLEDIDFAGERGKSDIIKVVVPLVKVVVPPPKFVPGAFRLLQNYPNPFNPETWIPYDLAADASVSIRIYDVKGQLVRQLDIGRQEAGRYFDKGNAAYWNGKDQLGQSVSSGLYFYMLKAGSFTATRRMVILK